VTLPVSLLNLAGEASGQAVGALYSSIFGRAAVRQGSAAYASIAPGEVGASLSPHFSVTIDPRTSCGSRLPFRLRAAAAGAFGDSSFLLEIGAREADGVTIACEPFSCPDAALASGIAGAMRVAPSGDDLRFSWPDVPDSTVYELWHSVDRDFSTAALLGRFESTSHVVVGAMTAPENGFYRVRAVNDCGWATD
ncbi:MAG TPA: hypothetical protein VD788_14225, partial [Candidatus Polarisedimenticolaceae bacterium]|nr:hypothetical protein [Candidatus Polarisedimenticolaceae bacterium]